MSDVFLSYKREDVERVQWLQEALVATGVTVFWDRDLSGGEQWQARLEEELAGAACVIVVWSEKSVEPEGDFVRDEARRARARGVLLPVCIDRVASPLGFGEMQTLDLIGWKGNASDPRFQDVLAAVRAKKEQRPPPLPRWPTLRRRRRALAWLGGSGGPLLFAAVLLTNSNVQQTVCRVVGIRALCRASGMGRVPAAEEAQLWHAALQQSDSSGLRVYLARYPNGVFSEEARARLAGCREIASSEWETATRPLKQFLQPSEQAAPTEQAAKLQASARGTADARDSICASYATLPRTELVRAESEVVDWHCAPRGGGVSCGFSGRALCEVRFRRMKEVCQ